MHGIKEAEALQPKLSPTLWATRTLIINGHGFDMPYVIFTAILTINIIVPVNLLYPEIQSINIFLYHELYILFIGFDEQIFF